MTLTQFMARSTWVARAFEWGKLLKCHLKGKASRNLANGQNIDYSEKRKWPKGALGLNTIIFKHVYWYMQQIFCLISWHSISIFSYFFQIMSEYDQTFDPNILIGDCDLISRFIDFALYLDTQLVYFHTSFRLWVSMTRPLTPIYLYSTVVAMLWAYAQLPVARGCA